MTTDRTNRTVELLQAMIRNACVNEGTVESGQEIRNAELLATVLDGVGSTTSCSMPRPGARRSSPGSRAPTPTLPASA
jgi:hypothetical protein